MRQIYLSRVCTGLKIIWVSVMIPALLMSLCVTTAVGLPKDQPESAATPGLLEEPRISLEGGVTIVELPCTAIDSYTVARASNPERIVVELTGVDTGKIGSRFPGKEELVEEVRIQQQSGELPGASVEILLRQPADYQVERVVNTLKVSIRGEAEKRADRVMGVRAEDRINATVIEITGNGKFQDCQVRNLGNNRLAVDLRNVNSQARQASIPTASSRIRQLHMDGSQRERLRIVVEFKAPCGKYQLDQSGSNLVLTVNSPEPVATAPTAALAAPTPVADAPIPFESVPVSAAVPAARPATADVVTSDVVKSFSPGPAAPGSLPVVPAKSAATPTVVAALPVATPRSGPAATIAVPKRDALQVPTLTKTYTGKPISLDLQEAEIKNVLRLLADVSGTNIVIEPDVEGKVTLKVNRVPWDQILDMILTMNNLGKEEVGGVIRIARQGKLKSELAERDAELRARQQVLESVKDFGEITNNYLQVNYAQAAQVASKLDRMKSPKGIVTVDERTNLILYSDYPARVQAARELLAKLDQPTPQVLIEARIVQLNANATKNLGIDWSWNFDRIDNSGIHQYTNNFAINHPVVSTSALGFTIGQIAGQTLWNIDMQISALEQAGKGKIVSSPRVLTLDNVEATIIQGQQIPYRKLNEFGVVSTEFKDAVLELKVVPHITPDQKIRLQINAKKEQANFTNVIGVDAVPAIDTRRIATELLVADGDTVVIGGVIEDTDNYNESRTPGLHKLPVLGVLFKSESTTKTKNEMLVFISPRITAMTLPAKTKRQPIGAMADPYAGEY